MFMSILRFKSALIGEKFCRGFFCNNDNNNNNNNNNTYNYNVFFNEDNILSKYTNLTYGPHKSKKHIKHNYIHIYKVKMSGKPKHCIRKYDKG